MTRITTHINARHGPRRRPMPRRARRGLINVLLTVAIVAIVLVGILSLYGQINTSVRTQTTQSILTIAEAELRRVYANQTTYDANLTAILFSVMPSNAIRGAGATRDIVTPWGGEVFAGGGIVPDLDGTGLANVNRFFITVFGLPEAACEALAQAYLNRSNVVAVHVEGAGTAAITAQTTAAGIVGECDGAENDVIAILFRG